MLWNRGRRQLVKQTLSFAKVKLFYARITLTRNTTAYFFLAAITFISLGVQQAVTFSDNSAAIDLLTAQIVASDKSGSLSPNTSLVILDNTSLRVCDSLPGQPGTNCTVELVFGASPDTILLRDGELQKDKDGDMRDRDDDADDAKTSRAKSKFTGAEPARILRLEQNCLLALDWLDETMHDAQREDVVTFFFEIWLFILAIVTILNESIPHLIAGLLGHALGAVWAGYRLSSTTALKRLYLNKIVPDACGGIDVVGAWWDVRIGHAIPIVVVNSVSLATLGYLSFKLFKVYATQSFSRVGTSPAIHRIYKIVLVFSVFLQLSAFFSLASSALWIDKVSHGAMHQLARHSKLYLAAFLVTLLLLFPWLVLGWVCVRRECKIRFGIFCVLSLVLVIIPSAIFGSPMYRYIVSTWPFFATVTITAYVLAIFTVILGVVCRLNFGQGLEHFLHVTDALEDVDFTPVFFPTSANEKDAEEFMADFSYASNAHTTTATASPSRNTTTAAALSAPPSAFPRSSNGRGSSIYSDVNGSPILLSSSPPLVSDLASPSTDLAEAHSHRKSAALSVVPYPELPRVGLRPPPHILRKSHVPGAIYNPRASSALGSLKVTTSSLSDAASVVSVRSLVSTSTDSGEPAKRVKVSLPANPRAGLSESRKPI